MNFQFLLCMREAIFHLATQLCSMAHHDNLEHAAPAFWASPRDFSGYLLACGPRAGMPEAKDYRLIPLACPVPALLPAGAQSSKTASLAANMDKVLQLNGNVVSSGMQAFQRPAASAKMKALSMLLGSPAGSLLFVQTCCQYWLQAQEGTARKSGHGGYSAVLHCHDAIVPRCSGAPDCGRQEAPAGGRPTLLGCRAGCCPSREHLISVISVCSSPEGS